MEQNILVLSGMILGVTAVVGEAGLASRYKPLFSLFFGVGIALLMFGTSVDSLVTGIFSALSAMGLWSGMSKTANATIAKKG